MLSRRNPLGLRRRNRSGSSLLAALHQKNQRRESRKQIRSLLMVENLEHRHLLAALVGVDFDIGGSAPTNWTSIGTQNTPFTQSNLVDEDGNATPFDLTISGAGGSITAAAAFVTGSTVPTHTQSLSNIDGQVFTDVNAVTLTWSDLTVGTDYEVYVFGLEGFYSSIQQDVTITGAGTPVSFLQSFNKNDLFINDAIGSSGQPLAASAKLVTADNAGEITIQVDPNGFTFDVSLGGVAIREATAPELSVSISPGSISEGAGAGAATGTVTRNSGTTGDLIVNLSSNDPTEATVQSSVTILDGKTFATFPINAEDDLVADLIQTVTITATGTGHADGTATLDVVDDDQLLTVSLIEDAVLETAGADAVNVMVTSTTAGSLTVNLQSSNPSRIGVPPTVTLTNGFAIFSLNVTDNLIDDGSEQVTITATAASYVSGEDGVTVIDDEFNADLSVEVVATSIAESDGPAATTATVSRSALGPVDLYVNRGVSISDDNASDSSSNDTEGVFTANLLQENPSSSLDSHEVSLISDTTGSGFDARGFVNIATDSSALNPINDASFFDVYFDLGTSHTFALNGRVFASAEEASALATLELTGPGTNLTFSQTANLNNNGGLTNINETGTLGPGTYHLVARAEASSAVSSVPAADAEFDLDLQLTAAALTVNLASDDTSEATVQSTISIPAGQTTSAPFNIAAQTDGIVDGTQTVTITASAASHNDGTDTVDVTDVDTPAPGFTVAESDGYTLVFEDGEQRCV